MLDSGNPQAAAPGASPVAQGAPGGGGFKDGAQQGTGSQAYLTQGYTLAEIGQAVGLHYATISRIITALEKTSACKMGPILFDPLS